MDEDPSLTEEEDSSGDEPHSESHQDTTLGCHLQRTYCMYVWWSLNGVMLFVLLSLAFLEAMG